MTTGFTEEFVDVGDTRVHLLKGGSGDPVLVLHGAGGHQGWRRYIQALAERYTVYVPSHPGYGQSERPGWLESMNDLACFYTWFMEQQGLDGVRAIGFSMGGWLAAEIAVACRHAFSRLMLVDPIGIKPNDGEIADIFIISPAQVLELMFHDPKQVPEYDEIYGQEPTPEQVETAERNREMAVRLIWKPYAHDPRLPQLLARVSIPTRIVWGRQDHLVPLECGQLYQKAIPGSELVVVDDCGHQPQIEKPDEFIKLALDFMA
jgi:pimeloyl-ACP methyl ester carboxylesterase